MASGMYASYNSYTFDHCEVSVTHSPKYSKGGALESYDVDYSIASWIKCTTSAAQKTAVDAIRAALGEGGQTLTIKNEGATGTTVYSFGASDCNGHGPFVSYQFPDRAGTVGNNFWVSFSVSGNTPPEGSGDTLTDEYNDNYQSDATKRLQWTRSGTQRVSTAWEDQDAAFSSTLPSYDSSTWELVSRSGKLDEDKKVFEYSYTFTEKWEDLPAQFAVCNYTTSRSRRGMKDEVSFNASVKPNFDTYSSIDALEEDAIAWAKSKFPKDAEISTISSSPSNRNGECSISIVGVAAPKGNRIEFTETKSRSFRTPHVIHNPMKGDEAPWGVTTGAEVKLTNVSGRMVGLTDYPSPPTFPMDAWNATTAYEHPYEGPEGNLLFAVSYSYTTYENIDLAPASGGPGAGGGGGGGASGRKKPSGGRGGNKIKMGDISGFSSIVSHSQGGSPWGR